MIRRRHRGARVRWALLLAAALGLATPVACERPVPGSELLAELRALERPHLVLLVVDTLRADRTTPYGYAATTPELSRWAARGALFTRARSQSSWTKVSMASMLTSQWPRTHGIEKATDGLASEARTLAEVLADAGYQTYALQTNGWLDQSFGFQQGFDRYLFPAGRGSVGLGTPSVWPHGDRVLDELDRILEHVDSSAPLFLYMHLMDVHEYAAPQEFHRYGTGTEAAYLAAIRWVDDVLARLRQRLAQAGLLHQSVIVFASDHGESFGENGRHGHARNVLTPVLHVPLVIRFPFPIEPVRVATQVRNLDIAPTLLDLAGVPLPASFEGESLLPLLTAPGRQPDRPSYASLRDRLFRDAVLQDSLTDGRWTYARSFDGGEPGELLFDRVVDPDENVNLARREPEQVARMRGQLDAYLAGRPATPTVERKVRIDPSIANRLRALGYLQDTGS